MPTKTTAQVIADYCDTNLKLSGAELSPEYYYNSLPLCLIDAIFSIGVRYGTVRQTVINYCDKFGLARLASPLVDTARTDAHTIDDFLKNMDPYKGSDFGASDVYKNRQRTSSRNGILKAEAVYRAALVFQKHGIQTIHDLRSASPSALGNLEKDFRTIPGQGSGISFSYLLMLAGDDDYMNIDRWLLRFHEIVTGSKGATVAAVEKDLRDACKNLKKKYPSLTPRLLGHIIWSYMRSR